jgi:hypothetical protein
MRNFLIVLLTVLALFTVPVIAGNKAIVGFDTNTADTLSAVILDMNSGKVLNIHTLVMEDFNGTTANYYIAATADACQALLGIYEANIPTGAPAGVFKAVFWKTNATPAPVYFSDFFYWNGTSRIFLADSSAQVMIRQRVYNPALH